MLAKKFRQQGWIVGSRPATDVCPDCAKQGTSVVVMRDTRSHKIFEQRSARHEVVDMPKEEVKLTVVPPRVATPADRRRIQEVLDITYDTHASLYRGDDSDHRVASELKVPVAWVTEARLFSYGEFGSNWNEKKREEEKANNIKVGKSMLVELGERVDKLLDAISAIDTELRQAKKLAGIE
jgi:hypothetical protein